MKLNVKKEIFLIILDSLFHDDSCQINNDNCIRFYHFLLDTLYREILQIPEDKDADISLCNTIIEVLSDFDIMEVDVSFWNAKSVSDYLKDYSGLTDEEYQVSISKFRQMYDSIKTDFLLDFR